MGLYEQGTKQLRKRIRQTIKHHMRRGFRVQYANDTIMLFNPPQPTNITVSLGFTYDA